LQHEALAINDDGVSGIMPAGVSGHDGESFREHVDNLALALVSPLGADYDRSLAFLQMPLLNFACGYNPRSAHTTSTAEKPISENLPDEVYQK
jgi:hypothetical protein